VGRGRAHYQKKDYAAALTDYDAALRLVPDNLEVLAGRGNTHERAGLYDREDYSRSGRAEDAAWAFARCGHARSRALGGHVAMGQNRPLALQKIGRPSPDGETCRPDRDRAVDPAVVLRAQRWA
jgi:hypothetical protein